MFYVLRDNNVFICLLMCVCRIII